MSTGDDRTDAMLANVIGATEGTLAQEDLVERLAQVYYLLKDADISRLLSQDPERMKKLLPALSHLLRTTNIVDEKTIIEMKVRWRIAVRRVLFVDAENPGTMAEFHSWINFGYAAIEDTRRGWRGKLATERIRTFKIEGQAPKKGFLQRLFGGRR